MSKVKWMAEEPFGIMVHWVKTTQAAPDGQYIEDWNQAVNAFDVDAFCDRVTETGAKWLIFPFGHVAGGGYFCAPNHIIDSRYPGHCSKRNLILEIAQATKQRGLKVIGYIFTEFDGAGNISKAFADAVDWNHDSCDKTIFMDNFYCLIQEWAEELGNDLDGWWFDGCYKSEEKDFIRVPGWDNSRFDPSRFSAAARAGNPKALIAMCPGANSYKCVFPEIEDYLAGEGKNLVLPEKQLIYGLQWHSLIWIDCFWAHEKEGEIEPPRFSDDELANYINQCNDKNGAVTLNIGIYQDGSFGKSTAKQLKSICNILDP